MLPVPKPSTLRKTPLLALAWISSTSLSWSVMPTLKSPSVARMTRLVPFLMKFWVARS